MLQDSNATQFDLFQPKSDLAVLCHADYNRNNIMFKYSSDDKLQALKIIDFQTVRYAQPGIDLTTIFSLNVDSNMLQENFETYLHIYYSSLLNTIKSHPKIDLSKFSYDRILEDYAEHSWLGYMIITGFLPILEAPNEFNGMTKFSQIELTSEAIQEFLNNFGSEKILKHTGMYLKHCIDLNEKYVRND